jgi:hypothetical protein
LEPRFPKLKGKGGVPWVTAEKNLVIEDGNTGTEEKERNDYEEGPELRRVLHGIGSGLKKFLAGQVF